MQNINIYNTKLINNHCKNSDHSLNGSSNGTGGKAAYLVWMKKAAAKTARIVPQKSTQTSVS